MEGYNQGDGLTSGGMSEQQQFQLFEESLRKINRLVFDLLLKEVVPLAVSVEENKERMVDRVNSQMDTLTLEAGESGESAAETAEETTSQRSTIQGAPSHKLVQRLADTTDEDRYNRVLDRVRNIGFQVGSKLSELLIFTNNPNLQFKDMDLLLVMKFICRDVWKQLYGKQIDNLKTNHRGTFYLTDNDYQPIRQFSLEENASKRELKLTEPYLEFPVGIIKGVLSSLGYPPEQVLCLATFVDRQNKGDAETSFAKGTSFHVQITSNTASA
ncbi:Trs33 protein [Maudiozyma humilis]|uniref:Trs33 protein n=1 Tax=Maudiozyma humilis TaxID=51915 RepID=A0AAV5RTA1_MAUHU|nr:Trs33 protein [Kazachstania humilis]